MYNAFGDLLGVAALFLLLIFGLTLVHVLEGDCPVVHDTRGMPAATECYQPAAEGRLW